MLINTLPGLPTQSLEERFLRSTVQSIDESPQTEQSPRIAPTTSSVDNRFQGIVALFGYDNLSSAKSRILDVDLAQETSTSTLLHIRQQAGVAVLSKANSQPQAILALLDR